MGGGDLNLKKSWHPSTLRNIERVWKAEQKHEVEKQKIEQLQKELAEERAREEILAYAEDQGVVKKKEQRLDWMYQGPAALVDREDYLLGRKIDKTFELSQQDKGANSRKEEGFDVTAATSRINQDESSSSVAGVDLANKIREDPLFSIMKKEKEQRKNLLCNPVKMKQLQQMLESSIKIKSKKKDKKKEKQDKEKYKKSHKSEENYYQSSKNSSDNHYKHYEDKYHSRHRHNNNGDRHREDRREYSERHYNHRMEEGMNKKKKLEAEERERKLREMQENAEWREKQRKRNTKMYQDEDEREAKTARVDSEHFIKPLLAKEVGKGSLENRIRQKIFTIQRGSADMDKNFIRR